MCEMKIMKGIYIVSFLHAWLIETNVISLISSPLEATSVAIKIDTSPRIQSTYIRCIFYGTFGE